MATWHRDGGFGDGFETYHARVSVVLAFIVRYLLQSPLEDFLLQVDIIGHEIDTRPLVGSLRTG